MGKNKRGGGGRATAAAAGGHAGGAAAAGHQRRRQRRAPLQLAAAGADGNCCALSCPADSGHIVHRHWLGVGQPCASLCCMCARTESSNHFVLCVPSCRGSDEDNLMRTGKARRAASPASACTPSYWPAFSSSAALRPPRPVAQTMHLPVGPPVQATYCIC